MDWPIVCTSCKSQGVKVLCCECLQTIGLCENCDSKRVEGRRHEAWRLVTHEETCRTGKDLRAEEEQEATEQG